MFASFSRLFLPGPNSAVCRCEAEFCDFVVQPPKCILMERIVTDCAFPQKADALQKFTSKTCILIWLCPGHECQSWMFCAQVCACFKCRILLTVAYSWTVFLLFLKCFSPDCWPPIGTAQNTCKAVYVVKKFFSLSFSSN